MMATGIATPGTMCTTSDELSQSRSPFFSVRRHQMVSSCELPTFVMSEMVEGCCVCEIV
jgi:hypothetical protein